MGNYDAGVNDRKGINISWSEYDSSAQEHVFTFDTPMGDSNYVVVTDRSDYEDTNAIYIKYKSTTGFTAEWVGADPDVFSGSFIVYASTPTKTIGGGKDWFDANDNLAGMHDVYGTPYDETNAWNVKFTSMTGFNRKVKIETGDGLHSRIFPHSILETKTVDVSHIYTIHNLLNKPDIEIDVSSKTQFSLAIWHKMKEINNSYGIVKLNTNSQVVLHSLKYDTSDFVGNGFFESESITGLRSWHGLSWGFAFVTSIKGWAVGGKIHMISPHTGTWFIYKSSD